MSLRLLLVEDSHGINDLIQQCCEATGCQLTGWVRTEAEAVLWLDEHPGAWDVAIVDLILDQGSGINIIKRARQHELGRIVVFSSYVSPGILQHCYALGAEAVFDKAFPGELTAWLGEQVRAHPLSKDKWTDRQI